jgi:hypothetical protein
LIRLPRQRRATARVLAAGLGAGLAAGLGAGLALGLAGCAGSPERLCGSVAGASCGGLDGDCPQARERCRTDPQGATLGLVAIDSSPTSAAIYLDGAFIGYTPLRHPMSYTSQTSRIRLVAVPLTPGQAEQERIVLVPPLPTRVSFFMNNPPGDAAGSEASGQAQGRAGGG